VLTSEAFSTSIPRDCRDDLRTAERELRAFMNAVEQLFGRAAALDAARIWINRVETANLSTLNGHPKWRDITIMAASQLAGYSTTNAGADLEKDMSGIGTCATPGRIDMGDVAGQVSGEISAFPRHP